MTRANFSVQFGHKIKQTVDKVAGTPTVGRGAQRQFSNSDGQFRMAKVIGVSAAIAGDCQVQVALIKLVVATFPETVGAQTLDIEELKGATFYAGYDSERYLTAGDIVSVVWWNSRYWVTELLATCAVPVSSAAACCSDAHYLTIDVNNTSGLPAYWQNFFATGLTLTNRSSATESGQSVCYWTGSKPDPFVPGVDECQHFVATDLVTTVRHVVDTGATTITMVGSRAGPLIPSRSLNTYDLLNGSGLSVTWDVAWGDLSNCNTSTIVTPTFNLQTSEPSCSGQGDWRFSDASTSCAKRWEPALSFFLPDNYNPVPTPTCVWDAGECFPFPPDTVPPLPTETPYPCTTTNAEWIYRELSGFNFGDLALQMRWVTF